MPTSRRPRCRSSTSAAAPATRASRWPSPGYDVTIVDPSAWMLGRAADRARAAGVAHESRLVEASGEAAPAALAGRRTAAVLCHGVLMYVDDPDPMLDALVALAAPGGIVSIVAKNADVMALRPALAGDWAAALAAFDDDREDQRARGRRRGVTTSTRCPALSGSRRRPVAWYGVRLFTDGWTRDRPATDPRTWCGGRAGGEPPRSLSPPQRLFHLVGRRSGA